MYSLKRINGEIVAVLKRKTKQKGKEYHTILVEDEAGTPGQIESYYSFEPCSLKV